MEPLESELRPLVTSKELTKWLQISRRTLCRLRRKGGFPVPVSIGTNLRWRPEDIERWIADGGSAGPSCVRTTL